MANERNQPEQPQPQTASNPTGAPVENPFENGQPAARDVEAASEAIDSEQQFKEAQTERD